MKQVFEAQNTVEAHMIQNMLLQQNIHSHLQGEFLQGGVGELQASFVKVVVENEDYLEAIKIIREWEDKQPKAVKTKNKKNKLPIFSTFIGVILGASATAFYLLSPFSQEGIDYNLDGNVDHQKIYNGTRLKQEKIDRNFDGTTDLIHNYTYQGLIKSSQADEDFNGSFETNMTYLDGNLLSKHSDTTGDGYSDYQIQYEFGVIKKISIIDSQTKKTKEVQNFDGIRLIESNQF